MDYDIIILKSKLGVINEILGSDIVVLYSDDAVVIFVHWDRIYVLHVNGALYYTVYASMIHDIIVTANIVFLDISRITIAINPTRKLSCTRYINKNIRNIDEAEREILKGTRESKESIEVVISDLEAIRDEITPTSAVLM
jgi:hypothetical protein